MKGFAKLKQTNHLFENYKFVKKWQKFKEDGFYLNKWKDLERGTRIYHLDGGKDH